MNDGSMVMLEGALIVGKSSPPIVNDGVFTVEGQDTSLYVEGSEAGHLPKFVTPGRFERPRVLERHRWGSRSLTKGP